jgi:hypothetical protein
VGTHHFVKVFDLADTAYKDWSFPAFGLIFVSIGLVLFVAPRLMRMTGIPFFDFRSRRFTVFRFLYLGFALFWTITAFAGTFLPYWKHRAMVRDNACRMVEGTVDNFVPMPATGHADESFSVADVPFAYSDYAESDGFNNAASLGGPIRAGQYVRICYDPDSHTILRLEIRDYSGPIVQPAVSFPPVPRPPSGKEPVMPWYASLFVYAYFLDWIGQLTMYRPYLRRFIRLGGANAVHAHVSANVLHGQAKTRLKNTLIQPDGDASALWLRPRGFNVFQVPLQAAKLNVDPVTGAVTTYEIRLSIGLLVVLPLFFLGAFSVFSQAVPAGIAALFVGGFAVIALVANAFHFRRLRRRMVELVEEALPELATR